MKTIGIIGGFGPEATAMFYLQLVDRCRATRRGAQPHIIMRNVSVPANLEHDVLVLGKNVDQFVPLLVMAAKELEKSGADTIVLPCNTLHVHEQAIRSAITIPFVSVIDATAIFLQKNKIRRVGFLGSRVTVRENLFSRKAPHVSFISPDETLQRNIDRGLDHFVATQEGSKLAAALREAFVFLQKKKLRHILLACTDFHGLCPNLPGIRIHDTLDILVRASVDVL
jgi:aspartate racemase